MATPIQIPDGQWLDPDRITGLFAYPDNEPFKESKNRLYVEVSHGARYGSYYDSFEEACAARDALAARLGWATAPKSTSESKARTVAEALGGVASQSGDGGWLVVFNADLSGRTVVLSQCGVVEYASSQDFANGIEDATIPFVREAAK